MPQVTYRFPDELVDAIRRAADREGVSRNHWVTIVLRAATDPEYSSTDAERLRERFRLAGILSEPGDDAAERPHPKALARARRSFSGGTPASQHVTEGRGS